MTGVTMPPNLLEDISRMERRIHTLETQQQLVFTDPTGASGDAANGHAVVVLGSLKQICGINAFGIASHKTGAWVQL